MFRKGRFAVVGGKEYRLVSYHGQYYLRSTNSLDVASGFVVWHGEKDVYLKKVMVQEFEDAYEIFPYVILCSHRFAVEGANHQTGTVLLVTSNPFVQNKVNVTPCRSGEYLIQLPISEVVIQEEKIKILGFEYEQPLLYEQTTNEKQ